MKKSIAILTPLFAAPSAMAQGLETVVLDLNEYCGPLLDYANKLSGPTDRLSFEEYKGYVNELITLYSDPYGRGNIYQEIDLSRNETSAELKIVFDQLANQVCQDIFQETADSSCSNGSIQVFDGINDLAGGTVNEGIAFMFSVCERTVQFMLDQVRSDSPSMAPSYSGALSFSNNFQVEAVISAELRNEGKEPTLESAGNILIRGLEQYTEVQDWDFVEVDRDGTLVNCGIQFFDRTVISSQVIACPARRRTFATVDFDSFQCFRYTIETNVRISSDSACIAKRESIADSLKRRFDNAYRNGELNTFLCNDTECYILTFIESGRDWILPLAYGLTGAIFLTFAVFTCRNKTKAGGDDDSMSSSAIEVEFPIPQLPRDEEPIQIEQKVPVAL